MIQEIYANIAIISGLASLAYIGIYCYQHGQTPKINLVFSMAGSIASVCTASSIVYILKFSNKPATEVLVDFQVFTILAIISMGLYSVVVFIDTIKTLKKNPR